MSMPGSHKEGNKFFNTIPTDAAGLGKMVPILKEYINNSAENTPKKTLGPFRTNPAVYETAPSSGLRVTWIGHSSLIIEIDGIRILTDPVWSNRVSFTQYFGPKRFFQPPLALTELPKIDAIISSHDHYDHLDKDTIKFLADKQIPFICSLGVGKYLESWGTPKNYIHEVDWGDSVMIGDCRITAAPARHFSGRGAYNRDETLWSSFVIKGPEHNIYFGADSGYSPQFKEIGDTYGPFDLTMLEIGAYGKYWPDIHMGPDHASNAHIDLKGKIMMPIHWGTFNLAPHSWYEPAERIERYAVEKNINLFLPQPGQPTEAGQPVNTGWWKHFMQ